jgi:dTDP-4-dehydrorhamnose reductase
VFAGTGKAYRESDLPAPNSIYGQSLWEGEEALRHAQPQHIILRPSWLFGSLGNSFLETVLRQAKFDLAGLRQDLSDEPGHPTPALDVAKVLLAIIQQLDCQAEVWGTYHYCGAELTTWREFIDTIIAEAKIHHICQFINGASGPVAYRAGSAQPSILDCTRLFETFGIKQKSWRPGLVQALKALAAK